MNFMKACCVWPQCVLSQVFQLNTAACQHLAVWSPMRVFCPQLLVMVLIPLDQALLVQLFSSGHASFTRKCGHCFAWRSNYHLPIEHGVNTSAAPCSKATRMQDALATTPSSFVDPRSRNAGRYAFYVMSMSTVLDHFDHTEGCRVARPC